MKGYFVKLMSVIALIALVGGVLGCAKEEAPPTPTPAPPAPTPAAPTVVTIKVSSYGAPKYNIRIMIEDWMDMVKTKAAAKGYDIQYEYWPDSTLLKLGDGISGVKAGTVHVASSVDSYSREVSPEMCLLANVNHMPGDFDPDMAAENLRKCGYFDFMKKAWDEAFGVILAGWTMAPAFDTVFTSPVKTLEDWDGKIVRATAGGYADLVMALGGSPVAMPLEDIYMGLKRGTMDGLYQSRSTMYAQKIWEVAPHWVWWGPMYGNLTEIMNKEWFEGLPKDLQEIIMESWEEAELRCNLNIRKGDDEIRAKLEANPAVKLYILPDDEKARWFERLYPIWDTYREQTPELWDYYLENFWPHLQKPELLPK